MPRLFGTDGVRGVANAELTPELVLQLARATAAVIRSGDKNPRVIVGRDTRLSGDLLESALTAGFLSSGADVIRAGVLPTPAVAFLTKRLGADAGVVISASHNPVEDNGIKLFGSDGFKLTDAEEEKIEALMETEHERPTGGDVGRAWDAENAEDLYVSAALSVLEGRRLEGLRVVVDCAHGAACRTTPRALEEAGVDVVVINAEPDGTNINVECGSTYPEVVAAAVTEHRADVGLAHDGDADRVIAVDEKGGIVDGDVMLALLASQLKTQGRLSNNLVVTTVMSNLGLREALGAAGIEAFEAAVGDRYVLEAMRQKGAVLGGEQSGHVILLEHATTGDGLITALSLLDHLHQSSKPLSELALLVPRYPQVMINVRVADRDRLPEADEVWEAVEEAESRLGDRGRVLVRPSGTEPVIRVMVEAAEEQVARDSANELAAAIRSSLGEVID